MKYPISTIVEPQYKITIKPSEPVMYSPYTFIFLSTFQDYLDKYPFVTFLRNSREEILDIYADKATNFYNQMRRELMGTFGEYSNQVLNFDRQFFKEVLGGFDGSR